MRLAPAFAAILVLALPTVALAEDAVAEAHMGFISILPPLFAIVAALVFRQVIPALFVGLWFGAAAVNGLSLEALWTGLLDTVQIYAVGAIANADHAAIIIFTLTIGGMVGIVSRSGGMLGVVGHIAGFATNARRAQLGTAGLGLAIFFDDYTNTLVVGNTMRAVTDRLKVSREKLAYIVDSTAAPVACIALLTTWIGYEVGLIDAAIASIDELSEPYLLFLHSIAYSFYPILAIVFVFMVASSGRDFGPMHTAERRAGLAEPEEGETVIAPGPAMSEVGPKRGVKGQALNAVLPIGVLLAATFSGMIVTGEGDTFRDIIGSADAYKALLWGSLLGALVAGGTAVGSRALDLAETIEAWLVGAKAMMMGMLVLVLAWSLVTVTEALGTANYLVALLGDAIPASLLPTLIFVLAAVTAFATGTSWGTMGILMPLVVPLTWAILSGDGGADAASLPILYSAISSVLAGAVWGDHCSPISDTTIMSSIASGCDHIAHVRTQMPYALLVGVVAIFGGTLPAGFGMPWWLGLVIGTASLWFALRVLGRRA
jgi:Na+/H+ antiporter NhaC